MNIEQVFDKPGKYWTSGERELIIRWLFEEHQFKYLIHFCLYHLGYWASDQDAEDAWSEFCSKRLHSVINSYDPQKGRRFWNFLLFCLERECKHMKRKIEKNIAKEETFKGEFQSEEIKFEIRNQPSAGINPSLETEYYEFLQILEKCLGKLPIKLKKTFQLVVLQDRSYEETSSILDERVGNLRVYIFRAKQMLRGCLGSEGWRSLN